MIIFSALILLKCHILPNKKSTLLSKPLIIDYRHHVTEFQRLPELEREHRYSTDRDEDGNIDIKYVLFRPSNLSLLQSIQPGGISQKDLREEFLRKMYPVLTQYTVGTDISSDQRIKTIHPWNGRSYFDPQTIHFHLFLPITHPIVNRDGMYKRTNVR